LSELYYEHLGIHVTCIGDQGLEVVQIVVHCLASLVIGGAFQSIDCICFCVNWKEVNPELLLEVPPGLDGENTSVRFLMEHIIGPLGSTTTFEERESPKNPLFFVVELFQGQADIQGAGV